MRTAIVIFLLCLAASTCATVVLPANKNESLTDLCINKNGKQVKVPLKIETWTDTEKTIHVIRRWRDWEGNTYEHYEQKDSRGVVSSEWYMTSVDGNLSTVQEKDIQNLKKCTQKKSTFPTPKRLLTFVGHSGSRM